MGHWVDIFTLRCSTIVIYRTKWINQYKGELSSFWIVTFRSEPVYSLFFVQLYNSTIVLHLRGNIICVLISADLCSMPHKGMRHIPNCTIVRANYQNSYRVGSNYATTSPRILVIFNIVRMLWKLDKNSGTFSTTKNVQITEAFLRGHSTHKWDF